MEECFLSESEKEILLAALAEAAGSLSAEKHPHWATSEKVAAWVRAQRQGKSPLEIYDQSEER